MSGVTTDIEIEINGQVLKAKPNSMVIQVADDAGIYIPRFCYHKHLSVAANCRMCLVEVEKSPKTLPACATPVMPGMKIFTKSPKALAAQKAVMEFLLINHPLDCPICDQGGECELQDLSLGFGAAESNYTEEKRVIKDQDLGPLIATDMTRCIYCTRCVRFGDEIAGLRELGATGRGEHTKIGTFIEKSIQSEVSGNVIDLCPVGALTSKPFRFTARPWELNQTPTIAAHDCIGSNINAHTRSGTVMRVVPRENNSINETWISDRDRFSYEGLYHPDRVGKPMIRVEDRWEETDWQTALEFAVNGLQRVISSESANEIGALASPNSTLEEFYLLQKWLRQLGSANIDHRLRQIDFSDQENMPRFPGLNSSVADLEKADVILLVGSNIQKEQPIAALRLRKAARRGAKIAAINMMDYDFHFDLSAKKIIAPQRMHAALNEILQGQGAIADLLQSGKKIHILLGAQAFNHSQASSIRAVCQKIATQCHATLGYLTEGANAAGAWLAGAVPHRAGLVGMNASEMLQNPRKAYVLLNVEPDLDCANPVTAANALEDAEFVVSLATFRNTLLDQHANVILPVAPFTETAGTFVNAAGEWQTFTGVANAFQESRPAWKVLRVLGNLFDCTGFDYESQEEVRLEVIQHGTETSVSMGICFPETQSGIAEGLYRIGEIPIYAGDGLVRRANALQATQGVIEGNLARAKINPTTAKELNIREDDIVMVKQQENSLRLPITLDDRMPEKAVWIAGGLVETNGLDELFGPIELHKL